MKEEPIKRMKHHIIHRDSCFKDYSLSSNRNPEFLHTLLEEFEFMFASTIASQHKTLYMRLDPRFPDHGFDLYHGDNEYFTDFLASFMKNLKRKGLKPRIFWVREKTLTAANQHYHMVVLLDGNKTKSPYKHFLLAQRLWVSSLGIKDGKGLMNYSTWKIRGKKSPNSVMLRKDDDQFFEKVNFCFESASYLCKTYSKNECPKGVHMYGFSGIGDLKKLTNKKN